MIKKQWVESKGNFSFGEIPSVHKFLPPAIYELEFDSFTGNFFLKKVSQDFMLPTKMYGLEDDLIKRVLVTFEKLNKNFGVLLKGLKGTGKTIAAKVICNKINLPVILVNKPWANIGHFINSIDQDIVLFFDEFEKTYEFSTYSFHDDSDDEFSGSSGKKADKPNVNSLLTLMDGVFTSSFKRLFLLTTNKDYLPDPMIARPSRIRYVKDFTDLNYEGILEILNDSVENKKLIPELAKMLKGLEIITVDIVKSVAEEANIYDSADPDFFAIFNVKRQEKKWDVYEVDAQGNEKLLYDDQSVDVDNFQRNTNVYLDGGNDPVGNIVKMDHDKNIFVTKFSSYDELTGVRGPMVNRTFIFKRASKGHASMMDFAYARL